MSRILVVEDEQSFSDALSFMLRKEGFDVSVAADGQVAVEMFEQQGADIVLLDIMLPGMSGTEVCRQIRTTSQVPIIMVTAKDSEIDKVVGLEIGADDYVTKPFSMRELMARVRALLRRSQMSETTVPEPPALTAGDIEVDVAHHHAFLAGKELMLTSKEFDLLAFLIRNKGLVFSREQLLEKVWDYDFAGETRTVDVHIRWLRQKIESDAGKPRHLVTIRGVGYKLED
jgi:DNA-binding response OmpR family regulator